MGQVINRFWSSLVRKPLLHMRLQDAADPRQFMGRKIWASTEFDGPQEEIEINDVKGCAAMGEMEEAQRSRLLRTFQINGTHFCSIYSFYIQMHDNRRPTEEEEKEFNFICESTKGMKPIEKK